MPEPISALWIGNSLGPMERLAITSFLRQGHEFHLYCYDAVANVPPGTTVKDGNEILPASSIFRYEQGPGKGSVAAFSNLFRYKLLFDRGGWWVDADVLCLKPFDFPEPVVLASEHTRVSWQVTNAIIRLPPGHAVAQYCYEQAVRRDKQTLQWGEIGPKLLSEAVVAHNLMGHVKGANLFCPLPWWGWRLLLCDDSRLCLPFLDKESYAVHLWHEMWRRAGVSDRSAFAPGSLFARLLQQHGIEP